MLSQLHYIGTRLCQRAHSTMRITQPTYNPRDVSHACTVLPWVEQVIASEAMGGDTSESDDGGGKCSCMCLSLCAGVHECVHVCVFTCAIVNCVYMYTCVCTRMRVRVNGCTCERVCVCVGMSMCICVSVRMCACVGMRVCTFANVSCVRAWLDVDVCDIACA